MHLAKSEIADVMYLALPSVVQLCFLIYMLVSLIMLLDIFPLSILCLVHCFKHGSAVLRHSATEYQTLFLSLVFSTSWWGLCFYVNRRRHKNKAAVQYSLVGKRNIYNYNSHHPIFL